MDNPIKLFDDPLLGNMLWNETEAALELISVFGNCYTHASDNSQRFLKQVTVRYNEQGQAAGVHIGATLLEKTRVTTRPVNERNFTIFYQVAQGICEVERELFGIRSRQRVDYLSAGNGALPEHPGWDDLTDFGRTRELMAKFNMELPDQREIFGTPSSPTALL